MVTKNPLFYGKWTAKKLSATVMDDIWPEVIFFTLIATMVVLVSEKTEAHLGVSNQLLTVLGLVLGLVISFRTSSAYERYQEGRKLWTNIIVSSKNLAQMIWIHIPDERVDKHGASISTPLKNIIEKKTVINLIQAFPVSVKHLLRGEPGAYYEDLYPLISFLPGYTDNRPVTGTNEEDMLPMWRLPHGHEFEPMLAVDREKTMVDGSNSFKSGQSTPRRPGRSKTFDPEALLPQVESKYQLKPARNPPQVTVYDYFPFLRFPRWISRVLRKTVSKLFEKKHYRDVPVVPAETPIPKRKRRVLAATVESHIPLEIYLVLSSYSAWLMKNDFVKPPIATAMTNTLSLLQDSVSNLARICNTPLPFAYQVHLRMSLWIYLALLPFQIYDAYHVITIPATAFASFLLLGFLEIGQEIENPFNYDLNDLDLDYFCLNIQRDLHEITAFTNPNPSEFIFTARNQPFAPSDRRSAADLIKEEGQYRMPNSKPSVEPGLASVRRTLLAGWNNVDAMIGRAGHLHATDVDATIGRAGDLHATDVENL